MNLFHLILLLGCAFVLFKIYEKVEFHKEEERRIKSKYKRELEERNFKYKEYLKFIRSLNLQESLKNEFIEMIVEAEDEKTSNESFYEDSITVCVSAETLEVIEDHLEVLIRKKSQMTYKDDYGLVISDKWDKECEYFVRNVLLPIELKGIDLTRDEEEILDFINSEESITAHINVVSSNVPDKERVFDLDANDISGYEYEEYVASLIRNEGCGTCQHSCRV